MTPSDTLATAPRHRPGAAWWARHAPLAALLLGLGVLYAPTVWSLAHGLWQDDTHSHGPLVLLGVLWLFVHGIRAHARQAQAVAAPRPVAGGMLLGLGLLLYVLGRSQGLYVLEVGSALPVVLGGVLLTWGMPLARKLWFAFVFLLFLVPLPGSLIDTITQPMKIAVSWAAEHLMHAAGYPVARAGVVLGIGPYQLFVADACAGLNSLFMLEAFGLLYLNVIRHESALRNAVLAVLIVPISFVANVLRVVVLALVTYHYGDAAGQGFIHSFSGVVLFGVALVLTVGADGVVRNLAMRFDRPRRLPSSVARPSTHLARPQRTGAVPARSGAVLVAAATLASAFAAVMEPAQQSVSSAPDLATSMPQSFGDWKTIQLPYVPVDVVPAGQDDKSIKRPYDQTVMHAYQNSSGDIVGLAIAYSASMGQEVKIHRPDYCYAVAGYRIVSLEPTEFGAVAPAVAGRNMYVEVSAIKEAVSYWIRVGDIYSESAWQTRLHMIREGLKGHTVDGVLVRTTMPLVSQSDVPRAHAVMQSFLAELYRKLDPSVQRILAH